MNIKGPMCVGMDGTPLKADDYQGTKMNNFENSGLYIRADLQRLVTSTVLAPSAPTWFELLVKRLVKLSGVGNTVRRSALEN